MLPPAWKTCEHGWVLGCALQSFLCTSAQVLSPETGGTKLQLEQEGLNGWEICLHTGLGALVKLTMLHLS